MITYTIILNAIAVVLCKKSEQFQEKPKITAASALVQEGSIEILVPRLG